MSHLSENKSTEKRLKRLLTRVLFSYKQTAACVSIKALMYQEPENPVDADAASFATLCVPPKGATWRDEATASRTTGLQQYQLLFRSLAMTLVATRLVHSLHPAPWPWVGSSVVPMLYNPRQMVATAG